ncbi:hypothetical protein ACTQ49_02510 [Luteococcus sp. Sow4_B9]|uniref:hypothetical protein n=1 Tax=Luteococcus sp. Sow4_B9 TaxID=3438792 RepID=UPI003F9D4298
MANDRTPPRRPGTGGREFGRDGVTGLVNADRALRAREVSRPTTTDRDAARGVVEALLARATGRRR